MVNQGVRTGPSEIAGRKQLRKTWHERQEAYVHRFLSNSMKCIGKRVLASKLAWRIRGVIKASEIMPTIRSVLIQCNINTFRTRLVQPSCWSETVRFVVSWTVFEPASAVSWE
jgi:hypothetical protein